MYDCHGFFVSTYLCNDYLCIYLHLWMKTTVGHSTWRDEKGKFRASFLLSEAVAAMLGMDIKDVKMYTTYEKVDLRSNEYSPTEHRGRGGQKWLAQKNGTVGIFV